MHRWAAIFLLVAGTACATARPSVAEIAVEDLDGRRSTLASLRGHAALLYLFTTSCDVCLADMTKLRALDDRYRGSGVRIVGVALDPDGARIVRPFAENLALPFPIVVAGAELRRGASSLGPIAAVPRVIVVDATGRVQEDLSGVVTFDRLAAALERARAAGPRRER
ncbi:MAG: TlpA family protein disulfide reductase [Deltaproteobacteria bacterium]|nr:TlpA family protein disulfide reductase [Deltaproteobacteria bacterium]